MPKFSKVLWSKKSDEWETPQKLFDELNEEFHFTLDSCATAKNAKCMKFYTKRDNGLEQDWVSQNVFMNPPYSEIYNWVEKAYNTNLNHTYAITVALLPARTDTKWFHEFCYKNSNCEIRFIKGRLKFNGAKNSAPFPSMICIFR